VTAVRPSAARAAHSPRSLRSLLLALILFLLVPRLTAEARVWHIRPDGSGDAPTIQAGVEAAATGDSVVVHAGLYADTIHTWIGIKLHVVGVHLDKNLSLIGKGAIIDIVDDALPVVAVYAEGVDSTAVISGFKITTESGGYGCIDLIASSSYQARMGLRCVGSGLRIIGNEIAANDVGVDLYGSAVTLEGNEIHGCGTGLRVTDSSDAVIRTNKVYQCGGPLSCSNSSPKVISNDFYDCCGGLSFADGGFPEIVGNHIHDFSWYEWGNLIYCATGALIENNRLYGSYYGITISGDSPMSCVVRGNVFQYQAAGIAAYAPNVVIENNTLDSGGYGWFGIYASKANTTIRNNIVVGFDDGIMCSDLVSSVCECNDVYGARTSPPGGCCASGFGNFAEDPQFCGVDGSGNFFLQSDSPCAPGNHPGGLDCGLIGAKPVHCGTVSAKNTTWGSVKSRFSTTPPDR
jgi:hypothetical protein